MSRISELWSGLSPNARRGVVGGAIAVCGLGLVGAMALGGGDKEETVTKAKPTTTTTTTTAPVVTTTTQPPHGPTAPLTGLRVADPLILFRPALAVKVDNLDAPNESALPQTGLTRADIVFEEVVEGNITRLVGIFHSQQPGTVGPVRSARGTDVELLAQFRHPLLAWSGGNDAVVAAVHGSPYIIDVGANAVPSLYHRDRSRRAPHNLYVNADEAWSHAPAKTPPPEHMFLYRKSGEKNPPIARKAQGVDLTWGGGGASSPVSWRWDPKARVYVRSQHGRVHKDSSGTPLTAKNVVVMVTNYSMSGISPVGHSVGTGELFVFTNGRVIHGNWVRTAPDKVAALFDDDGKPVKLTPGNTFVELPKTGGTTAVTK